MSLNSQTPTTEAERTWQREEAARFAATLFADAIAQCAGLAEKEMAFRTRVGALLAVYDRESANTGLVTRGLIRQMDELRLLYGRA